MRDLNKTERKIFKILTRAMEDTRGLDEKYPNQEDSEELAYTLNNLALWAVDEINKIIKNNDIKRFN